MENTENKSFWQRFYDTNALKANTPDWISNLNRTPGTRNITIDVWNELANQVRQIASDSDNVLKFVRDLKDALANGEVSELMAVIHEGNPLTLQRWFDSHLTLFPSIKNVHYVPEDPTVEHIDILSVTTKGEFTHDEMSTYPGYLSDILSDGDTSTVAYNPKYTTEYEKEHTLIVRTPEKFVSKVLVYSDRITNLDNFDTIAKYTVSYGKGYGDPGTWEEVWGNLSGVSNPQIIDIHKEIEHIQFSVKLDEESSEKLPIYEIDVLGYNATGYYVFELTNGETFRIATGNLNSIIDTVSVIEANCQGYAQKAEDWANVIKNLKGQVGGYPELEHIEGEHYPKIPSHYLNQVDIKQYVKVKDESELDTVEAQIYDIAIVVGKELTYDEEGNETESEEDVVKSSWLLYNVDEDGTREWIKFGLSYATNAGYATYANNAGRANDARKINGLAVTKISEKDFNNLSDAEKENGIYFVVLGIVEGDSND